MGVYRFFRHQVFDFIKRQIKTNCLFMLVNISILLVCYTLFFGGEWLKILEPYGIHITLPQRQPYGYPGYGPPPGYPGGPPPPGWGPPPPGGWGPPPPGWGPPPPGYGYPPGQAPPANPSAQQQASNTFSNTNVENSDNAALSHEVPAAVFEPQANSDKAADPEYMKSSQTFEGADIHYESAKEDLSDMQVSSDYESEKYESKVRYNSTKDFTSGQDLMAPISEQDDELTKSKKILAQAGPMPEDLDARKAWRKKTRAMFRHYSLDKDTVHARMSALHESRRSDETRIKKVLKKGEEFGDKILQAEFQNDLDGKIFEQSANNIADESDDESERESVVDTELEYYSVTPEPKVDAETDQAVESMIESEDDEEISDDATEEDSSEDYQPAQPVAGDSPVEPEAPASSVHLNRAQQVAPPQDASIQDVARAASPVARAASVSSSLHNGGSPVGSADGAIPPERVVAYIPKEGEDFSTVNKADVINYSNYDWEHKISDFDKPMPNLDFIFHNKMPKCGSSTMNNILIVLARTNRFYYQKLNPHNLPRDQLTSERPLVDYVRNNVTATPFVLLKHHFPFNFEKYGIKQPTYLNVIRDPVDWFQSHYYFERFGWERGEGDRNSWRGTEAERLMTVDECVLKQHSACTSVTWKYIEFLCGNQYPCHSRGVSASTVSKGVEKSKYNLLNNFYVVGILEQWDDTLNLFERMMPRIFKNVQAAWKSDRVQQKRKGTKSVHQVKMNNASRLFFQTGPLKYEWDLYSFARHLFNERMRRLNVPHTEPAHH